MCHQLNQEEPDETNETIFRFSMTEKEANIQDLNGDSELRQDFETEKTVNFKSTLKMNTPYDECYLGTCVDSGGQITFINLKQAEAYFRAYGEEIKSNESRHSYPWGDEKHDKVCKVKIGTPLLETHVVDISADVIHINIPFLLGFYV